MQKLFYIDNKLFPIPAPLPKKLDITAPACYTVCTSDIELLCNKMYAKIRK